MSEYTPTTGEVREQYWAASGDPRRDSEAWGEFDRWLRKVQSEAFFEGVQHQWKHRPIGNRSPHNPYL